MFARTSSPSRELIAATFHELVQAERSASVQTRAEAERLHATPPGYAMAQIADDAAEALPKLEQLVESRNFGCVDRATMSYLVSIFREGIVDRMLNKEMSYRTTLLGVRHGIDLVRMLWELGIASDDRELVAWCDTWLTRRFARVSEAEGAFSWFALNPALAMEPARGSPSSVRRWARAVLKAVGGEDGAPPVAARSA
ncbi:MAG TPA: hypothetical protein VER33_17640 [Polyangiaceae bacterium]|nr:hypothetical protein [Polyangiaceae bacterium]